MLLTAIKYMRSMAISRVYAGCAETRKKINVASIGDVLRQEGLSNQGGKMKDKVIEVLDEVRPGLQADGGDVELVEVTADGIVRVKLTGACAGCPMSTLTLRMAIEKRLKERIPEVKSVEQVF
jgi:Fe-S cluster biogenesis protein NfuA